MWPRPVSWLPDLRFLLPSQTEAQWHLVEFAIPVTVASTASASNRLPEHRGPSNL
jgi:hypothetical protein